MLDERTRRVGAEPQSESRGSSAPPGSVSVTTSAAIGIREAVRKKTKDAKRTHFGLGPPPPRPEAASVTDAKAEAPDAPVSKGISIEHTQESGSPSLLAGPWRAFEIWTQNRVYGLDAHLVCIEVFDRVTSTTQPKHPIVGSRLLGGQRRSEETGAIEQVSHPLPGVGASAVFSVRVGRRVRVSETSPVTQVAIRQRVVDVGRVDEPNWDDITGQSGEW